MRSKIYILMLFLLLPITFAASEIIETEIDVIFTGERSFQLETEQGSRSYSWGPNSSHANESFSIILQRDVEEGFLANMTVTMNSMADLCTDFVNETNSYADKYTEAEAARLRLVDRYDSCKLERSTYKNETKGCISERENVTETMTIKNTQLTADIDNCEAGLSSTKKSETEYRNKYNDQVKKTSNAWLMGIGGSILGTFFFLKKKKPKQAEMEEFGVDGQ